MPLPSQALPPEDISFVPLKQTQEFNARDLLQVGSVEGAGRDQWVWGQEVLSVGLQVDVAGPREGLAAYPAPVL